MDRLLRAVALGAVAIGLLAGVAPARAEGAFNPAIRPVFREPVTLSSKGGVLEVTLTAHQGHATLDTVAKPVENFLVFAYRVERGTVSNGEMSGDNLYPAPTLQVFPGETLIVHLDNALTGLTIRDFFDPRYTGRDAEVPLYEEQLTEAPINLHVHGVHVSPKGNADNVMLHIPPGMSNTYTYQIPTNMPQGAYWYHSHLHTLTTSETYFGLAGLLAIGRTDGNLPLVTANHIPIRNMLLQYNAVYGRKDGMAQLNNPYWPQFVSTLIPPTGDQLAKGTYRPLLTPVNFGQSKPGTDYFTVWWAGPLSILNYRGLFQYIPSNLQRFTAFAGQPGRTVPADPALPDWQRDVQFTVNGQFQPVVRSQAGQTEIWVLANISDVAYMYVQLTETATGRHPQIAIVGQDGNPAPAVHYPPTEGGTRLLIPPATRVAIAVTMPASGDLVLEMPPRGSGAKTISAPGVLYTSDGTDDPPAVLGSLSVLPSAVSYADGFFVFPTQVLARAVAGEGQGETTAFAEGQALGAYSSFADIAAQKPDVSRELLISGGFLNDLASKSDPRTFVYAFDGEGFPNTKLIQPRLGSVEEWTYINHNNDEHPIHIHVNDFQVTHYFDPTTGLETGPDKWAGDNANIPAPSMGANESVIQPGLLSLRTRFDDYTGLYVQHCHRLNHEDNGLMAMINVIPAVSTYAVAVPGSPGHAAEVRIHDGNGDKPVATVTPFPGFEGTLSVAMGDVDADNVLDLVVGAGPGHAPEIVAYSGSAAGGKPAFTRELARFAAFAPEQRGGVSVAVTQIDGSVADNIIAGSGAGPEGEVRVFGTALPASPGTAPALFSSFAPYPGDRSGVTVSAGFVDLMSGRNSIVTAPGPGTPAQVKVFYYSLMTPIGAAPEPGARPAMSAQFWPFGEAYAGGVSLATGWLAGALGGTERIVVGQQVGGAVAVYSSGSALQGGPAMYLLSAMAHEHVDFVEMARFTPFGGGSGVSVATTSTTVGADLLVSGVSPADKNVEVRRYQLVRPTSSATALQAVALGTVAAAAGAASAMLGGD
jgi:FtsP/CotA-like multicopper oxidase with cupredoxin domain